MHTVLIHQVANSPDNPGGTRHYELARHCIGKGHQITIVAGDITFKTGKRMVDKCRWATEQIVNGVHIIRTYSSPGLHKGFAGKVFAFLVFTFTSFWGALSCTKVDLVMGTTPPIFQTISAWLVAVIRRRPFLLEVRDLWPEFAVDMGILRNPTLIWLARRFESWLYARATHIIVNSPAYRDYLLDKGVPAGKISLVANGVDPDMFDPAATGERFRRQWAAGDQFVVTYAGALGLANDIPTILRAAARLLDAPSIRFWLVGDGPERKRLEKMAEKMGLTNVVFTGAQAKADMKEVLGASDACLATLRDIPMFHTTYPNKVFDYMGAGRPTVLAIDGVIRQVVEAAGGGIFVPPGDDAALAAAVRKLSRDRKHAAAMGSAARDYVIRNFNRYQQGEEFVAILERLAGKS
jgi:glycosyltransferase involved in cell wall biosynthesis